jgi:hypothetical protein
VERVERTGPHGDRSEAVERLKRLERTGPGGFVLALIKPSLIPLDRLRNTSIFSSEIEISLDPDTRARSMSSHSDASTVKSRVLLQLPTAT